MMKKEIFCLASWRDLRLKSTVPVQFLFVTILE